MGGKTTIIVGVNQRPRRRGFFNFRIRKTEGEPLYPRILPTDRLEGWKKDGS